MILSANRRGHMFLAMTSCLVLLESPLEAVHRFATDDMSQATTLPNTQPLTIEGDLAAIMVAGVDRFLLRELDESIARRAVYWRRDLSSSAAYVLSVEANRQRLSAMIGLRDQRLKFEDIELVTTRQQGPLVGRSDHFQVFAVRWPVFEGVHGEGLLLEPTNDSPVASIVVIPDCKQSPESLAGLDSGIPPGCQIARRLAESGCRVVVPALINRDHQLSVIADGRRRSTVTHREILNRAAYQMGRHLIGYEVQKILAAVDWFRSSAAGSGAQRIGVAGYGEGGLLALYAAAIDTRIDVAGVSGYFDSRQNIWREPIDRNIFGLLREFGDAEIATLVVPRALVIEACAGPAVTIPTGGQSAPGQLMTPALETVRREVKRAHDLLPGLKPEPQIDLVESGDGEGPFGSEAFLELVMRRLAGKLAKAGAAPANLRPQFDAQQRLARQFHELASFSQRLVYQGPEVRAKFFENVDYHLGLDRFAQVVRPYREYFRDEIIGVFSQPRVSANPRTRLVLDEPEYRAYEVMLDVFPDVILTGVLLIPTDIRPREKRPVVVCQHGLEGLARWTVEGDYTSYRAFAARLAKRGFITFSPQHLYRGGDSFRTLQRKANPLKKSLFSVMIAQHQQLLAWLAGLDFVDGERIGFYGISYGGKSAMRIPAVLEQYRLSICSSDFSNWIWRTVSNRFDGGYLAHSEYEIFEFNLGCTFNYAEMAALICPRPFMVERFDEPPPVLDTIAAEYGRIRLLYENLGIGNRTRISNFPGYLPSLPYRERETFDFLQEQLRPRSP